MRLLHVPDLLYPASMTPCGFGVMSAAVLLVSSLVALQLASADKGKVSAAPAQIRGKRQLMLLSTTQISKKKEKKSKGGKNGRILFGAYSMDFEINFVGVKLFLSNA